MKKWYLSKTLWVNVVALLALILQGIFDREIIGLDTQAQILVIINIVLRIITSEGLHISEVKKTKKPH